jgi:hypothetical protein
MLQDAIVFSYYVPDRYMRLCRIKYLKKEKRKKREEERGQKS